jgi:hypothetical protein
MNAGNIALIIKQKAGPMQYRLTIVTLVPPFCPPFALRFGNGTGTNRPISLLPRLRFQSKIPAAPARAL